MFIAIFSFSMTDSMILTASISVCQRVSNCAKDVNKSCPPNSATTLIFNTGNKSVAKKQMDDLVFIGNL